MPVTPIVTVTPLSVLADSRTYKQAASVARFGYHSIVVEGAWSEVDRRTLPFELHSIGQPVRPAGARPPSGPSEGRLKAGARAILRRKWLGAVKELVYFPVWALRFLVRCLRGYCLRPLRSIPKASLYYLHSYELFPAVYLRCKRYGVPYVYDAHDFYRGISRPSASESLEDRFVRFVLEAIEAACVRHAAVVVTVNTGIAGLMREALGRSDIYVMRNAQDPRLEQAPVRGLREYLSLPADAYLLACVGQAKRVQAFEQALEAMRLLPPHVHLAFIGKNHEARLEEIRALGLDGRVHVVPAVKPWEVSSFISSADASIILYYPLAPNVENCLPNGFFQSIAARLPLLYPDLPEIRSIAEARNLGLMIDPKSPSSIREAVLRLMESTALQAACKRNVEQASVELTWEHEEPVLRGLLARLLADGKGDSVQCVGSQG